MHEPRVSALRHTSDARATLLRVAQLPRTHPMWTVILVAFAARVLYIAIARPDPFAFGDAAEYDRMARALLAGGGFLDDIAGFVRPPLFPLFLAACYAVGGVVALQAAQVLLSTATVALIGLIARLLRPEPHVATGAALAAAIYPWFFEYLGQIASETLFVALSTATLAATLAWSTRFPFRAGFAGVLLGVAALARANVLALAPLLAGWWWWRAGTTAAASFVAAAVLVLSPFTVFELVQGNGLLIASSGGGQNFYVGNNPSALLRYRQASDFSDDEWRRLTGGGLVTPQAQEYLGCAPAKTYADVCAEIPMAERERYYYAAGLRWIVAHPDDWAGLVLQKAVHFWTPWVDPRLHPPSAVIVSGVSFAAALVLALVGLRRMPRSNVVFVLLASAAVFLNTVLWLVQLRYRFALLDPLLLACAGAPVRDLALFSVRRLRSLTTSRGSD